MDRLFNPGRWPVWGGFALVLLVTPWIFSGDASLSIFSQMGAFMIFALSYNMLLGQGGMLSFGHSAYSGLGAFFAVHAMNLADAGVFIPVTLVPLVGGLVGLCFGVLFGYVSVRKSGIGFAMITLGIVELVYASALIFTGFFGGDGGLSTNRVYGDPLLGVTFGPQIEVYYLIAFWLFVSTLAMYAYTQTPLGRIINAVRDNAERAEFIGYDARHVRYLALILSSFFAGISGSLIAINFEIIGAENVSLMQSGTVLLFTFIGGVNFFFGPILGAVVGVFMTSMLSIYTNAWQLYLGVLFIFTVMYAPGGIAGVLMLALRISRHGKWGQLAPGLIAALAALLVMITGVVLFVELLYHVALDPASGPTVTLFGVSMDATIPSVSWVLAVLLSVLGGIAFHFARRPFLHRWEEINLEIEDELRSAP